MKKQLPYIFLFFAFVSCTDSVKFNSPTFEGRKDNVFWRAVDAKAKVSPDGSMIIEAFTRNEKVTLKTTSTLPDTYLLGNSIDVIATYDLTDAGETITFSTGTGIGDGEIVIEEYDAVNKTVTGTFKFNAENVSNNPLFGPLVNFQYGTFYKVPVTPLTL